MPGMGWFALAFSHFLFMSQRTHSMGVTNLGGRWIKNSSDWPGSRLQISLISIAQGNISLLISLQKCASCNFYLTAIINCDTSKLDSKLVSNSTTEIEFVLPSEEEGKRFDVEIVKRTEASTGIFSFNDVRVKNAVIQEEIHEKSCMKLNKKMLVVGDSITAGYGVDGLDPCDFSPETENIFHSYAMLTAVNVSSDLDVIAWSGRGVVRNYGDMGIPTEPTVPDLYNRTIANLGANKFNYWESNKYQAEVILINLGTNDYSTEPIPSNEAFTDGLITFTNVIKSDYPQAKIALLCPYSLTDSQCLNIKNAAYSTDTIYYRLNSSAITTLGCDGHPSYSSQQNLAALVIPLVKKMFALQYY